MANGTNRKNVCLRCDKECGPKDMLRVSAYTNGYELIADKTIQVCDECVKNEKLCLNCGRRLREVIDPMSGKISGNLYTCNCMPQGVVLSIG